MTFQHGKQKIFRAPLGVAVVVDNYAEFDLKYIEIVEGLKAKYGTRTRRSCVKGHFIAEQIGNQEARKFVAEFVEKTLPLLRMVYVNHVIVPPTKISEISFANGRVEPAMKFMYILTSSFNHLIIWNLLCSFPELKDAQIFSDYFTGMTTKAWEQLESNRNVFVLPAGEYCNSLISTADIMCKYVNDYLFTKREKFGRNGISKAFSAKGIMSEWLDRHENQAQDVPSGDKKLYQTDNGPFRMATPSTGRSMDVDSHMKHPVTFVLPSYKLKKESEILWQSTV